MAQRFEAIVIGVSAGGMNALGRIVSKLNKKLPVPVFIVQHLSPDSDTFLAAYLDSIADIHVCEAEDKIEAEMGVVYIAPPNYHLLVEYDKSLALSVEERVNYSRPSIDVLFDTAAQVYRESLIGVVLTGANSDGAVGLHMIKKYGGTAIVQSPESAEVDTMPKAAIKQASPDYIIHLDEIGVFLNNLVLGKT